MVSETSPKKRGQMIFLYVQNIHLYLQKKVMIFVFVYYMPKFTWCMLRFTGAFCEINLNSEFRKHGLKFVTRL